MYANHPQRPRTPPNGRSSIDKFVSSSRSFTSLPHYFDIGSPLGNGHGSGVSYAAAAGGYGSDGRRTPVPHHHGLSTARRESLLDLPAALVKLLEGEPGHWEHARKDDAELKEIGKRKNGAAIVGYYERQNSILDGFAEVDAILTSHFPQIVMARFGTIEEVIKMNHSKLMRGGGAHSRPNGHRSVVGGRKQTRTSQVHNDDDSEEEEDDGYEEDDEDPSRTHGLVRAAGNAITGLWFGKTRSSFSGGGGTYSAEQSPLLSSSHKTDSSAQIGSPDLEAQHSPQHNHHTPHLHHPRGRRGPGVGTTARANTLPAVSESSSTLGGYGATDSTSPVKVQHKSEARIVDLSSTGDEISAEAGTSSSGPAVVARDEESGTVTSIENKGSITRHEGSLDRKLREQREAQRRKEKARGLRNESSQSRSRSRGPNGESRDETIDEDEQEAGILQMMQHRAKQPESSKRENERKRLMDSIPGLADKDEQMEKTIQFAININLAINVLLLGGKGFAVLSSNSISLIASFVDSVLDLLSTLIIFGASKAIAYRSFTTVYKYPVGKRRFEPLGVLIFSVVMIGSFLNVLVEAIGRLYTVVRTGGAGGEPNDLPLVGIIFMLATIGIKTVMWLLYRKSVSSGVRAVAQDAENDVVFNVASLIFPVIGSLIHAPALDPLGGVILSLYIIKEWLATLGETITKLSGAACGSHEIARPLYLLTRFKSILSVGAFEVYHAGDDMIVEADLVLPIDSSLKDSHDLVETATLGLECLTGILRAHLHLDYNSEGPAGHLTLRG